MITCFIILLSIQSINCIVYLNVNFKNKTEVNIYEMYVKVVCQSRTEICKVSHKSVCAVRKINDTMDYMDFENSCQVFMHNFCDSPVQEYYIVTTGKCDSYLKSRRNEEIPNENEEQAEGNDENNANDEATEENDEAIDGDIDETVTDINDETEILTEVISKSILRQATTKIPAVTTKKAAATTKKAAVTTKKPAATTKKVAATTKKVAATTKKVAATTKKVANKTKTTKFVPLYAVDTAFDDHLCPLSCPNTYSPVCVSANRGNGMYFKFFTFVNHCSGDLYYCKNPDEFAPAPDESAEDVNASKLGWSYCGASRYLQFARFSEAISSLGYYGWLAGDQKYSHIMEPYERRPGYG